MVSSHSCSSATRRGFETVTVLAIPFYDMIAFGVIIALAIYWRK